MIKHKSTAQLLLAALLILLWLGAFSLKWSGSSEFHTLMELAASLLALFVGVVALMRFYSHKSNKFLFIGTAFVGTFLLDGIHTWVTSSFFATSAPSAPASLIPWSWISSRFFLSVFLWLSVADWFGGLRDKKEKKIRERTVYLLTLVVAFANLLFFGLVPLPPAYFPELPFPRPEEFLPALFFALALFAYFKSQLYRTSNFDNWMALALITSIFGQIAFMSFSSQLFDTMFNLAHLVKILSYLFVLVGLLESMYELFHVAEQSSVLIKEEALGREFAEEKFSELLEAAPDGIVIVDRAGNIQLVNRQVEKLLGYSRSELLGKPIEVLIPSKLAQGHPQNRETFFDNPTLRPMGSDLNLFALRKDQSELPVEISLSPFQAPDGAQVIASIRDVTKSRENIKLVSAYARLLERSNQELQEFAYIASHDLQEPLRAVSSYLQLLEKRYKGQLDEKADQYIQFAVGGAMRMQQLIHDLLQLSRVGTHGKEMMTTNLNVSLTDALRNLETAIQESNAKVTAAKLPTLAVDRIQIATLFQNLIGNAIKFTKNSTPIIQISAQAKGDRWQIAVKDNGIGIDPKYHTRIFTVFQRLHTREEYSGTGIGLAVCKKIVERHGGELWVESEEGQGSTFYFTLAKQKTLPKPPRQSDIETQDLAYMDEETLVERAKELI